MNLTPDYAEEFTTRMYGFRIEEFIPEHKDEFLAAIRLYPEAIRQYQQLVKSSDADVYIVSGRDQTSIEAGLRGHGVEIDSNRTLDNARHNNSKQDRIYNVLVSQEESSNDAHFIDDHLPALVRTREDRRFRDINVYLAGWGYVNETQLRIAEQEGVRVIDQHEISQVVLSN